MYLSNFNWGNIFVIEIKNEDLVQRQLLKFTLLLGFCLLATITIGQDNVTVRPGDINNDGRVNRHDALFWGLAYGNTGDGRENPNTDFNSEQTLPINLWEDSFYNGLNFSYADCNGDGIIDDLDFDEGILDNLFEVVDGTIGWLPSQASSPDAPTVILTSDIEQVDGGQAVIMDIIIDSPQDIENFIGVSFEIAYVDQGTKIVDNSVQFQPINNGWLGDSQDLRFFSAEWEITNQNQRTEVVAVRRGQPAIAGQGLIGKLSIVMEDIVIIQEEIQVTLQNAVILAEGSNPISAYGSTYTFNAPDTPTNTIEIDNNNLKIFPNPVEDIVRIESEDQSLFLENVEVIAANGQQIDNKNLKSQSISSVDLDWSKYASGLYFLKITTSEGMEVRKLTLAK